MNIPLTAFTAAILLSSCHEQNDLIKNKEIEKDSRPAAETKFHNSPTKLDALLKARKKGDPVREDDFLSFEKSIQNLDDSDLARLIQEVGHTRNSSRDKLTFAIAVAETARRDPGLALSLFVPEKMVANEAGWSSIVGILAESSPELLQRWLLQELPKSDPKVQSACLAMALQGLSTADPRSAFEFSKSIDRRSLSNNEIIFSVFSEYGRQFPKDAEKAASESFKGADLDNALYNIAIGAASKDTSLGMSIASKIENPTLRGSALSSQLKELMEIDQEEAVKQAGMLAIADLEAVLKGGLGRSESIIDKLGSKNPEALSLLLGKIVPSSANLSLFTASVESLAKSRPELATSLIDSIPESEFKKNLTGVNYRMMAVADTPGTLKKAAETTDQELRSVVFRNIGDVVGRRGLQEIESISSNLTKEDKASFLSTSLFYAIDSDPDEAAKFIATESGSIDEGPRNELLSKLGGRMFKGDLNSVKEWIETLSPADQPAAMKGLATEMIKTDVVSLSRMLTNIPQDKSWEAGVRVLIQNISDSDPEMAKGWQESLKTAGYK